MINCKDCVNTRHVLNKKGYWEECHCLKDAKKKRDMIRAGIPKYMLDMTWKEWEKKHGASAVATQINKWKNKVLAGNAKRCACVWGPSGTGKLTLAYLVTRDCVNADMSAKVTTISDLIQDRFEDRELIKEVLDVDFLCLRLGVEENHKWSGNILERVHFGRKVEGKPTFYTTRLFGTLFEKRYGSVLTGAFFTAEKDVIVWDLEKKMKVII